MLRTAAGTIAALGALGAPQASSAASLSPSAGVARVVNVREEGRLHFVHSSGSALIDEGPSTGTLPGRVRVRFIYNGNPIVSAQFTIYGSGWSINGRASGRLSNPNSASPSFRGSLSLVGGSGRYAHAHGSGELFGVFYRRTYALTVQAVSQLRY